MTHDLRAKLAAAMRLAEGATTDGEREAAQAAIKRLKKAMKRTGQDAPFVPPAPLRPEPTPPSTGYAFFFSGAPGDFQKAFDEFLNGRRPPVYRSPENPGYPNPYRRK